MTEYWKVEYINSKGLTELKSHGYTKEEAEAIKRRKDQELPNPQCSVRISKDEVLNK